MIVREVAPAQFLLARPNREDEPLLLSVALIRDLRKSVPCPLSEEEIPRAWWADIRHEEVAWWQQGWQATPAPAQPSEPKLIPIVTTAGQIDALHLAQTYIRSFPAQENVIKDFLLPLGLDTNHGFAKTPVENSEVAKKREAVEKRRVNVQRFGEAAREKAHRASVLATKLWKQTKEQGEAVYRVLNVRLQALEALGVSEGIYRAERKKLKAEADAQLEPLWQRVYRVQEQSHRESSKHERYCREQRDLLRALEDLAASERMMHELDAPFGSDYDGLQGGTGESSDVGPRSLLSCHLCSCHLAAIAPIFPVAGSCAMGPGGGPGGTAAFQQPSTESRSARRLPTGERDPTTIARW
jgi:hypothetical protein